MSCAHGGVVPNCTQLCANCSCGDGLVAYNASCHNVTACPPNLDCARRNAFGVEPCVEGYELREGLCAQEPAGWVTPLAVAGIAVASVVTLAAAGVATMSAAGYMPVAASITKTTAAAPVITVRIKLT